MSLIQEINRTETEKNKTKQVAINIDNKLVELGGEESIDLSDVPNKMGAMIKENYKRVAMIQTNIKVQGTMNNVVIPTNTSFTPSFAFIEFENKGQLDRYIWDTRNATGIVHSVTGDMIFIKLSNAVITKEKIRFNFYSPGFAYTIKNVTIFE